MAKITEDRSCTLVGRFMRDWAIAEAILDEVIAKALKIRAPESWVVLSTITVFDKWRIVITLVELSKPSDEDKKSFKKQKIVFTDLMTDRNMLAHSFFCPTTDETAVAFLRFASKGKLQNIKREESTLATEWSEEEFEDRHRKISCFIEELGVLSSKLESIPSLTLGEALMGPRPNPFRKLLDDLGNDS